MYDGLYQDEKLIARLNQEAKVLRMYAMGVGVQEIAKEMNITVATIYNILNRHGFGERRQPRK